MKYIYPIIVFSLVSLSSCGSYRNTNYVSMDSQVDEFHAAIADTTRRIFLGKNYKSLGFGEMIVHKPYSFYQLDSVYAIKDSYIQNNDLRGLKTSGIEEIIPIYKTMAEKDLPNVHYEIEHLYQTNITTDSIQVSYSYYLFNHDKELISITPFYHFRVSRKQQELFYAFQFNYHFITDRDLYISQEELHFINHYKDGQYNLIGEPELQHFMDYTLSIMQAAKAIQSVDYRKLAKAIAISVILKGYPEATILETHELMVMKNNDDISGYSIQIDWSNENENIIESTLFTFTPYLELITSVRQ